MTKKDPLVYNNITYASTEEVDFQKFLNECTKHGLISENTYQPSSYILAPKSFRYATKRFKTKPDRREELTLFQQHVYTPDWEIVLTPKFFEVFPKHKLLLSNVNSTVPDPVDSNFKGTGICLIDVKGSWNLHGGDRIFPIHQKLMWSMHRVLVNKVVPQMFFKRLGVVPNDVKWMQNRKQKTPKKAYQFVDTFEDMVNKSLL